ncbi:MarR family winged helix-turn-helix transcriptional regulator [Collimonas humicola]|uniref:MarR family winged helix-turn-helix transcriptional regulator n=1 Tax=Collimonas humicola TaxID=2825886 RepID=UPI001B8BF01B|nr:MarR family transcriptional regulator [Collimonas humicola]
MSSVKTRKAALLQALGLEVRRMSAQGVLLSGAVAERVGVSSTDLECLDFIVMAGADALTPSQLATATGLTTGAITGLVDRLEKAGFVRREADPTDRRKVRVVACEERVRQMGIYYERLARRTEAVWAQFNEEQLRTVLEFARRSSEVSMEEVAYIRTLPVLKAIDTARKLKPKD